MGKKLKQVADIEEAQAALRESIEETKQLSERVDSLLAKHKRTLEEDEQSEGSSQDEGRSLQ